MKQHQDSHLSIGLFLLIPFHHSHMHLMFSFLSSGFDKCATHKGFRLEQRQRDEKPIPMLLLPLQPATLLYDGLLMPLKESRDPKANRNEARADDIVPQSSPEAFPLALSESDR